MKSPQIARRWAEALFNLSSTEESWHRGLEALEIKLKMLDEYPKFKKLLTSTKLSIETKEKLLTKIYEGRLDPKLLKFLIFLIRKHRFGYLPEIAREYSKLVKLHFGQLEAKMVSAVPVAEEIKEQLRAKIEADLRAKTTLISEIDPKILGGVMVIVENRILDGSLKTKLDRLNEKLVQIHI